jgi:hypothetical protein
LRGLPQSHWTSPLTKHKGLILRPSSFPEKFGIHFKKRRKSKVVFSLEKINHLFKIEINQPKNVKPKMKWCKLGSGVRWLGALKLKGVKTATNNALFYFKFNHEQSIHLL